VKSIALKRAKGRKSEKGKKKAVKETKKPIKEMKSSIIILNGFFES
jgi:hypothetical protein